LADHSGSVELVATLAMSGELDAAISHAREAGTTEESSAKASLLASLLLARGFRHRSASDLLDAAELLHATQGDAAAVCNRVELWRYLGLAHRARELESQCPQKLLRSRAGDVSATTPSAELTPAEVAVVEGLHERRYFATVAMRIRRRASAWRRYFEGEALTSWRGTAGDPATRVALQDRLSRLARAYAEAVGNPAPERVVVDLAALPAAAIPEACEVLQDWSDGAKLLASFHPEQAAERLRRAQAGAARLVPSLEPMIAASLASTRYHLGDHAGLSLQATALRRRISERDYPWVTARCLWLESLAQQGSADWELSAENASRAASLFDALGEPSVAGFLKVLEAFDQDSLNLELDAETTFLAAIRKTAAGGEAGRLATALQPFGRQQARRSRVHLATEIQREVLALRLAGGNPVLVVEALTLLAEVTQSAGDTVGARRLLEQAEGKLAAIASESERARQKALIDHVRAVVEIDTDPAHAIRRFTAFIAASDAFGERYNRAEALLGRARARLGMADAPAATQDLVLAVEEILAQSQRAASALHAAALVNKVRETLDLLVVLTSRRSDGLEALRWIETLKLHQQYRGLGLAPPPVRHPRLPEGVCATEFYALAEELLAWTQCGVGTPILTKQPVRKEILVREVDRLRHVMRAGEGEATRDSLARLSRWLASPLGERLSKARAWVVVPDAPLGSVPFAWLRMRGAPLFETLDVSIGTSLSDLVSASPGRLGPWRALAVGNPGAGSHLDLPPLPVAGEAAAAVAARFGGRALVGRAATYSAVRNGMKGVNLLHFAGHVYANQALPAMSRMQFAPESRTSSGRVSAQEIARRDSSALELVVLAGCSSVSDSGRVLGGSSELSQAYALRGAHAVVGTLWDVEDRTVTTAINQFYDSLASGASTASALRDSWRSASQSDAVGAAIALQLVSNRVGSN